MSSTPCPQCGTLNPAGARFCRACGLSLTQRPNHSGALHAPTPPPGATPAPFRGGTPPASNTGGAAAQTVAVPSPAGIGLAPLAPGATLQNGRYVIDRPLGKGGMGSVFLARDTHVNGKVVVIKEMANVYATEEERREAEAEFHDEMATLAALSHPNIPAITDFFTESNRHFAVQEYVPGQDLQKAIEGAQVPNGPPQGLPEKSVLAWTSGVLAALDYLEGQNPQVIHRDVKPGNIVVDSNNRVRLVDFGIASRKFKPGSTRAVGPQVSTALGTPGYAPKEQFTGQETPLSDLYALGATMHHLLTGRDPTKIQPLWQYPPVRTLNRKVSEATERIVARATQNDEKKRYRSAAEMKRDVDRVLNPPGALSTFKGRAIALLVVLLLIAGAGGGAYLYAQRPQTVGSTSAGTVAFDTDQTDLGSLGVSLDEGQRWATVKAQAAKDLAAGRTAQASAEYGQAIALNRADAESYIYREDIRVLAVDKHPYKIAVGGSFSAAADGSADDVSVGRQNLQGAYVAQRYVNTHGGVKGHQLYLVLADDRSAATGAKAAAQQVANQGDILALVGFAYSSRTQAALPSTAQNGIPVIAPTASSPDLNVSPYFFRICPADAEQGKEGAAYLLRTLLAGKRNPTVAVFGDPKDAYAGRLQKIVESELALGGARVVSETYTIGQQDFSDLANDVQARHVDGVYFAGYAHEALLLSQAMDGAGVPQSVPIMSDDGFYKPIEFSRNGTPKGRFHFTTYFFPDQYSLPQLTGSQKGAIQAMEATYKGLYLNPRVAKKGGYGTSRVSADTALYYDAVRAVAYAMGHISGQVTRASLQATLASIGATIPAYDGISGQIRYATPAQPGGNHGDPIDKALVVLHLDAALGRSHLDHILGAY